MILIVRTAQSTLETTNETAVPPLPPPPLAERLTLRQDQPHRALLVVPIHYVREADSVSEKERHGRRCVCRPRLLHRLLCRINKDHPSLTPTWKTWKTIETESSIFYLRTENRKLKIRKYSAKTEGLAYISCYMQYALCSRFTGCVARCWKTGIDTNIHRRCSH